PPPRLCPYTTLFRSVPGPQLDESVVVDVDPGLLGQLTGGSGADGLAGVDVPTRQRPVALVGFPAAADQQDVFQAVSVGGDGDDRSEEHTSELQSREN